MHANLLTTYRCNGGQLIRPFKDFLLVDFGETLAGDVDPLLQLAQGDPAVQDLAFGRVIEVHDGASRFEYRIFTIRDKLANRHEPVSVELRSIHHELSAIMISQMIDGIERFVLTASELTRTQWIQNYILPALAAKGRAYFTLGTVVERGTLTLKLDHDTPKSLLAKLVGGSPEDVVIAMNGTTSYTINLVVLNENAPKPQALVGRNVMALERAIGGADVPTVAKPVGLTPTGATERATPALTVFKVSARTGDLVTLVDPRDNGDMIAGDDHLNGLFLTVPAAFATGTGGTASSVGGIGRVAAYSPLKDRAYVFDTQTAFYGFELHPASGEIQAYLDNDLFDGNATGLLAVGYVPLGASGTLWLWTGDGKIFALDLSALTVSTVAASGALKPATRPIYRSAQDAVYYCNGTDVVKVLASTPFTTTTHAIGQTGESMAWVNSVSLFYIATGVASPAFRTFDPVGNTFASVTPTGATTYHQVEWESTQDRVVAASDNSLRADLINPNTNAIADTLTLVIAAGAHPTQGFWRKGFIEAAPFGTFQRWSIVGAGKAFFGTAPISGGTGSRSGIAMISVAAKTAVELDNARLPNGFDGFVAYDTTRGLLQIAGTRGWAALDPSQWCWEAKAQITDTIDATNQVDLASREALVEPGMLVGIARDANGTRLTTMPHAGLQTQYGTWESVRDVPSFRGERNLVIDPYSNEWFSTRWPKRLHHGLMTARSVDGSPAPVDSRARWDEFPASTVTVHAFDFDGAHSINATTINLKNGPINTVIPAGSRLQGVSSGTQLIARGGTTNGSGSVTLRLHPEAIPGIGGTGGIVLGVSDGDDVTVRIPPLGGTAPNGKATYTQWCAQTNGFLGRYSVAPAAYPDQSFYTESYTAIIRFGGYWQGKPSEKFRLITGALPGFHTSPWPRGTSTTPDNHDPITYLDDDTDYPLGVRFLTAAVFTKRKPGIYFDGVQLWDAAPSGHWWSADHLIVIDYVAVMMGTEPGTRAMPPFAEFSHANQLWRVGRELLDAGLQVAYVLEVTEHDPLRPFVLGAKADIRDPMRNIFTQTPRIVSRKLQAETQGERVIRTPTIELNNHPLQLAQLEAGPPGELGSGVSVDEETPGDVVVPPPSSGGGGTGTQPPPVAETEDEHSWADGFITR